MTKKYKQWKFNRKKSGRVLMLARQLLPKVKSRNELVEKITLIYPEYKALSVEAILTRGGFKTGFRYRKNEVPFGQSTTKKILTLITKRPRTSWELERNFKYGTVMSAYRKLRTMNVPIRSTLILARGAGSTKSLIKHQFRIFFLEKDAVKAYDLVEKTAGLKLVTKMRQSVGYSVKPKEYKIERATFKSKNPVRVSPSDKKVKELFRNEKFSPRKISASRKPRRFS